MLVAMPKSFAKLTFWLKPTCGVCGHALGRHCCDGTISQPTARRPCFLVRYDGHMALANSRALKLAGIDAAVNRRTLDGQHPNGWFPEQRITVAEAIRGYTLGAAYANFAEERVGSIAPGKAADLVVLSRDILAEDEQSRIAEARVVMTVMAGRIVYQAEP